MTDGPCPARNSRSALTSSDWHRHRLVQAGLLPLGRDRDPSSALFSIVALLLAAPACGRCIIDAALRMYSFCLLTNFRNES